MIGLAVAGAAFALSGNSDSATTSFTASDANVAPAGILPASGPLEFWPSSAVVAADTSTVAPASNVAPFIAEHSNGIDAALLALSESGAVAPYIAAHEAGIDGVLGLELNEYVGVAPYIAEHGAGIDAVLGNELNEFVGVAPYIEEHNRLIDAMLAGSQ